MTRATAAKASAGTAAAVRRRLEAQVARAADAAVVVAAGRRQAADAMHRSPAPKAEMFQRRDQERREHAAVATKFST